MITSPPRHTSSATPSPWHLLRSWWWVAVGAIVFAATIAAGVAIKSSGPKPAELGVDIALAQDRNPALSALSLAIHFGLGPLGAVVILVLACLFLIRRSLRGATAFASVVGVGWLASVVGKNVVSRIRPPSDAVHAMVSEHGLNSFPSGHTAFALSLACAFILVVPRRPRMKAVSTAAGVVFVALVAFSRLYLGVHYPSDVIASVFIAGAAILAWLPVWNNLIAPRFNRQSHPRGLAPGPVDPPDQSIRGTPQSAGPADSLNSKDHRHRGGTRPVEGSENHP